MDQVHIFSGNMINLALEKLTILWKYDFLYTLIRIGAKFRAHKRIFSALGTVVLR